MTQMLSITLLVTVASACVVTTIVQSSLFAPLRVRVGRYYIQHRHSKNVLRRFTVKISEGLLCYYCLTHSVVAFFLWYLWYFNYIPTYCPILLAWYFVAVFSTILLYHVFDWVRALLVQGTDKHDMMNEARAILDKDPVAQVLRS